MSDEGRVDGLVEDVPVPPSLPRRRWASFTLLTLVLCASAVGGYFWWRSRTIGPAIDSRNSTDGRQPPDMTPRSPCSDDADPKTLEALDFGPPIETVFDRRRLDALDRESIPPMEVYSWQPKELVAVLGEHRMRGSLLAADPTGKLLALGSPGDPFVRIGPADSVHETAILNAAGGALALAWSMDGETLAISCRDGLVRLFDVRDLENVAAAKELRRPNATITCLSFSGDGKYLVGGDNTPRRGKAWVWDVTSGEVKSELPHTGPVLGVAFSPVPGDYRALTSGGPGDGGLYLWDALAGKRHAEVLFNEKKLDDQSSVGEVAISPDGKRGLSCHSDSIVRLWDLDHLQKGAEKTLPKHTQTTPVAAFSPNGRLVASSSLQDGAIWFWDAQTGKHERQVPTTGRPFAVRFLGGDRLAYTGTTGYDGNVHIHDLESGKEIRPPLVHLGAVNAVALAPDGQRLASAGSESILAFWDFEGSAPRRTAGAPALYGLGFTPDAKSAFLFGAVWSTLQFVDAETGQLKTPTYDQQHGGPIISAAVTRDGRYAVTAGLVDHTVRMWSLRDGRQVRLFDLGSRQATAVSVSPDMRRAIAVAGSPLLLHLRCQEVFHQWPTPASWGPFLPDGRVAFLGGPLAPVWRITGDKPQEVGRINVNLTGSGGFHLSADGKRLAAIFGGEPIVYQVESGRKVWNWKPPPHFGGVRGVALSADGGHLFTANGDGTIYVVRLP